MKLSIVTTLYHSASYINEFYERACTVAKQLVGQEFEIIFVNDGSPDNSLDLAVDLTEKDTHVVVVDLSRNFGHHKAMMTGLSYAQGEKVFLIDSDLEEEPEWLLLFDEKMKQQDCDVVYGVQEKRKGELVEKTTGGLYFKLMDIFMGISLPKNFVTSRIMTQQYVKALLSHQERELNIGGLFIISGFDQRPCIINKKSTSPSTYTFRRKVGHLVNSITSFSNIPLKLIFYIGIFIFFTSLFYTTYLLTQRLFLSTPLAGWTSVIASIWLLGGMMISFIGVIGIYMAKIFSEVKQRPYTIIKNIYGK